MIEYKVGDKIYLRTYGEMRRIETVVKITPTLIKSENYSYNKPTSDSPVLHVRGQTGWQTLYASFETPELKKEWQELKRRQWLENNWRKISSQDIDMLRAKMEKK